MNAYLDILIFGVVAAVVLWRLRSVLGQRQEGEPPPIAPNLNKAAAQEIEGEAMRLDDGNGARNDAGAEAPLNWAAHLPNYDIVANATVHHHLVPFAAVDPHFRPDDFLDKAKKAYAMIVGAFASGDKKTLEFLLSPGLYGAFAEQIDRRGTADGTAGEVYRAEMHGLKNAIISDAHLDVTQAFVTVDFTAEQTILHKTADGVVVGDNDGTRQINKDRWVFSKDLKDPTPLWLLVRTESPEA